MKRTLLVLLLPLFACTPGPADGACELAAENDACPECADGDVTCTFEDTSVTAVSCGGCQARSELFTQLCDAGEAATRAEIEAGLECTEEPLP